MKFHKFALISILVVCTTNASAAVINFTHAFTASGTIDGIAFIDSDITVSASADTDDRVSLSDFSDAYFIDHMLASVNIVGVGVFELITQTRTFVNETIVGFSRAGERGADLVNGPDNVTFASWDMLSSTGPFTGFGSIVQWNLEAVVTSGGVLILDDYVTTITFEATVVPLPAAIWLMLSGLLSVGLLKRRQA